MSRVWLTCALVTAAIVTIVVVLTNRPGAEADGPPPPKPPPPLSEQEVRTYIEVMPQIRRMLGEIAVEFQRERILNQGKVDEAAFQIKSQAQVDALLERRHLTRETWQRLSDRVEYAVNVIRAGPELERDRPEIEKKIEMKRALVQSLAREDERAMVEKEIKDLEALLEGGGPPLLQEDRDLIRQYWRALEEAAPRRGPPPKQPLPAEQTGK